MESNTGNKKTTVKGVFRYLARIINSTALICSAKNKCKNFAKNKRGKLGRGGGEKFENFAKKIPKRNYYLCWALRAENSASFFAQLIVAAKDFAN